MKKLLYSECIFLMILVDGRLDMAYYGLTIDDVTQMCFVWF